MRNRVIYLCFLFVIFAETAKAKDINYPLTGAEKKGPHGGMVLSNSEGMFELAIDSNKKIIDVYTLDKEHQPASREMSILLRKSGGSKKEIHLKAIDPWKSLPHFQGHFSDLEDLNPNAGSINGVQVQIHFGSSKD